MDIECLITPPATNYFILPVISEVGDVGTNTVINANSNSNNDDKAMVGCKTQIMTKTII